MIRSNSVTVFGVEADGSKRSSVDNSFDLNDHRVEDVDVERLATEDDFEMLFEQADDAFPTSTVMTGVWWNELPLQSSFS